MAQGDARCFTVKHGYDPRQTGHYRRRRRQFLDRNPLCAYCAKNGLTVAAAHLDHEIATYIGDDFWNMKNWQGLCAECHRHKTAYERSRYPVVDEGD